MLTIQDGRFYKTRDGAKKGPMFFRNPEPAWTDGEDWWYSDGMFRTDGRNSDYDLVAEWVDLVEEPCPAQTAVEGNQTPEPFTHGDTFEGMKDLLAAEQCKSCGATSDFHWSHCASIISHSDPVPATTDIKAEIADEAKRIVSGARRSAYGKPEQNFERISAMWTAYAKAKGWPIEFAAGDVSPMMILMKLARVVETNDHRDSMVDIVGYTLTMAEVNKVGLTSSV